MIKTEEEYDAALREIQQYFENEPEPGSPAGTRFDELATEIGAYERERYLEFAEMV